MVKIASKLNLTAFFFQFDTISDCIISSVLRLLKVICR